MAPPRPGLDGPQGARRLRPARDWTGVGGGRIIPLVKVNPPITPWVVAGRIVSIIGMGFTAAVAILLFIIPTWWGFVALAAFFPFLGLIVLVEKYSSRHGLIGPEDLPAR